MLVELAELQDREVGDGTTSVVIIAAELLKVVLKILLLFRVTFSLGLYLSEISFHRKPMI